MIKINGFSHEKKDGKVIKKFLKYKSFHEAHTTNVYTDGEKGGDDTKSAEGDSGKSLFINYLANFLEK